MASSRSLEVVDVGLGGMKSRNESTNDTKLKDYLIGLGAMLED